MRGLASPPASRSGSSVAAPLQRLGDILVAQGATTRAALEALASKARGPIGAFLRAHGEIDGRSLSHALATQHGIAHKQLAETPADPALFSPRDLPHYQQHRYIPFARDAGILSIATPEPSVSLRAEARRYHQCDIAMVVISARDLTHYFATVASTTTTRRAQLALRRQHRALVADRILMPHQMRGFLLLAACIAATFALAPATAWQGLLIACNFFYLSTLAIKLQMYGQGRAGAREHTKQLAQREQQVAALQDAHLPIYSILVPLYRESPEVMARLIGHLNALDYPREKLDIKLICEADDAPTIAALKTLRPPETMEIICVPPSIPRTKPKACNIALQQIRGEFLVIFDAEDAPAPTQLKLAVCGFAAGGPRLACLQASLNYYNRDENLLTQLFAIEYSALFSILLPALERMHLPIPLGGTSNHLRVATLRDVGGWDAFNVTEDADLGIRLSYFGYTTGMLPSLTLEEAPITLGAWIKQRTRWIKGYIQTWLVYTRDTAGLKHRLGRGGYYGFQFFVGAPAVTFLLAPIFWGIFILSLMGIFPVHLSPFMLGLCLISFVGGVASHWLFARAVIGIEGWFHLRRAMLIYPLYWLLHSVAAARALWQLATAPHYWEKTRHGVSIFGVDTLPAAR